MLIIYHKLKIELEELSTYHQTGVTYSIKILEKSFNNLLIIKLISMKLLLKLMKKYSIQDMMTTN
jgi:hypothetical protein